MSTENDGYKELERRYGKWKGYPLALMHRARNEDRQKTQSIRRRNGYLFFFGLGLFIGVAIGVLCK